MIRVEVLRRYSRQTYQGKSVSNLERILQEDAPRPQRTGQARPLRRLEWRLGLEGQAQLVADYVAGLSTPELQARYGLSKGSVLRLLHEAGVQLRHCSLPEEQLTRVVGLYESGLSIRQVAAKLGIPKTTVQNALARSGVGMRPARRQRRSA